MGLMDDFRRGYGGDETQHYRLADKQVTCPHCGGRDFDLGSAQLNTAGLTLLNLDWANRSAHTLICVGCSRIEWFLQKPERI